MITFFEQAGVDEEYKKAADRRSGECPRKSEQLHLGVEGLWRTETAGETHSSSDGRHRLIPSQYSSPSSGNVVRLRCDSKRRDN